MITERTTLDEIDRQRLAALCVRIATQLPEIATRFYEAAGVTVNTAPLRIAFVDWLAGCLGCEPPAELACLREQLGALEHELGVPRDYRISEMGMLRRDLDDRVGALYDASEARLVARSVDKLLDGEVAQLVRARLKECDERLASTERATLAERIGAIQTLSTGFAHELRNPVNSARLQLELLERRLRNTIDPRIADSMAAIDQELERLSRLLKEFLAFARPPNLALNDRELGELVGGVLSAERPFADSRGVDLAGPGPGRCIANIDGDKVTQVVQNLVHNAIEACKPGGHVGVRLRSDQNHVHVDVEDDGPGIPEPMRRRIFEPFFTTKDSGTGLGLSIAHSVMAQHGGSIELHTNDRGTRFELIIPRRHA